MLSWVTNYVSDIFVNFKSIIGGFSYTNVFSNISMFENLILMDGIFTSIIVFGIGIDNLTNKKILQNYRDLYKLDVITRYGLYFFTTLPIYIYEFFIEEHSQYRIYYIIMSVPLIQNTLIKIPIISLCIKNIHDFIETFIKYTISKICIKIMQSLDKKIDSIQNYHIFILYNNITYENAYNFAKSYIFIYFLMFMRMTETTYYYYKAIKLSYYYKTGFLFNIVSNEDAVYLVNHIIRDKKWNDIFNIDFCNALYTLVNSKMSKISYDDIYIKLLKFFCIWNIVSIINILNVNFKFILCLVLIIIQRKNAIFVSMLFVLNLINTSHILLTIMITQNQCMNYIYNEIVFFTYNYYNIKQIINTFKNK